VIDLEEIFGDGPAVGQGVQAMIFSEKAEMTVSGEDKIVVSDEGAPTPSLYADWVQAPDTRGRLGWQTPDSPVPFPAREDLPGWSDSTPAEPRDGACWWCGRRDWWRSVTWPDVVRCGWCHPPVSAPGIEWLNRVGDESE